VEQVPKACNVQKYKNLRVFQVIYLPGFVIFNNIEQNSFFELFRVPQIQSSEWRKSCKKTNQARQMADKWVAN
jgi:hypothetical protein